MRMKNRDLPDRVHLPLQSEAEFDEFEEKAADTSFQKALIGVIGDIGGRTLKEAVRRSMQFCMSNELASKFNMIGSHQKRSFGRSQMFETVYRSLKRNAQLGQFTQHKVEGAVSKWLTGSRDRDGKRTERAKAEKEKAKRRQEHPSGDEENCAAGARRGHCKTDKARKRTRDESDAYSGDEHDIESE